MTPTPDTSSARRRALRRPGRAAGAALVASALLVASACASESGSDAGADPGTGTGAETDAAGVGAFDATPEYLQHAADQSTAEGYRIEVLFSIDGEIDDDTPTMMTGGLEGDRFHYVMDLGAIVGPMTEALGESRPAELDGVDMTIEMARDDEALYLRAPVYAELADTPGLGPAGELGAIGDGWGYVDMAELGDQHPSDLTAAMGSQGFDPQVAVRMIETADDVSDLGSSEVRGVAVQGLSAEVTIADMLEASGQDPDALAEVAANGTAEEVTAALYDTTVPVEVWVDDDGYLRRLQYGYSLGDVLDAMSWDPSGPAGGGMLDLDFAYAVDMFDYGAELDFEPPDDAVDITDAFAALVQA